MNPSRRNALVIIVLAAAGAYAFHRGADNFWGVISCGLDRGVGALQLLPIMDAGWRIKVGFVAAVFFGALRRPLADARGHDATASSSARPTSRTTSPSASCKGLDLQGGLRLVYTVEVEEAIRDKRDQLRRRDAPGARDDLRVPHRRGPASRATSSRSSTRRSTSRRPRAAIVRVKFKDPADVSKLDERFQKKFAAELVAVRAARARTSSPSRSARRSRPQIREQRRHPGEGHRQPPRRRARPARGERHDARRGHHRRGPGQGRAEPSTRSRRSSARPRASSSRWSTTRPADFFSKFKEADQCKAGDATVFRRTRASRSTRRTRPPARARRVKTPLRPRPEAAERDACSRRLERLQEVGRRRSTSPTTTRSASKPDIDYDPDTGKTDGDGLAHVLPLPPRRGHRRLHHRRARRAVTSRAACPRYYVAITFSPAGADRFEEITGANVKRRFAIILDDVINSAPVIQTKIGGGRASITLGAGDPEQQLEERARSSSSCSAPARCPRRSRRRTSRSSAPRSARTPSRKGVEGRARRRRARARLHDLLLPQVRRRRRHRGALQPAPPARDPRVVQRHDDAARHRRPRAHDRHGRRRQRAHQRAHPRGAARRTQRPRRGRGRLRQGVLVHHRRPRHGLHLRPHPRAVRHRPGQGLRRHAHRRHHRAASSPASSARASSSTGGCAARR